MPPEKRRSYASLQVGRAVAALLVVLHHVSSYIGDDPRYWKQIDIFVRLVGTGLGVQYFFVLSGVVIFLAHRREIDKPSAVPGYVWKRFKRIYPIYWLILIPLALQYFLRPGVGAAYQRDAWVLLSNFLLIHLRDMHAILPVAWTLFHEILFYSAFATLMLNRKLGTFVVAVWGLMSIVMSFVSGPVLVSAYLFAPVHLLFLLGMLIGFLLDWKATFAGAIAALGTLLFAMAVCLSGWSGKTPDSIQLLAGVGAAAAILGFALLEVEGRLKVPGFLNFLGNASYSIYLVHFPFLMFFAPLVFKVWSHHPVPIVIPMAVMLICATIAGSIMHIALEKPLLKLLR